MKVKPFKQEVLQLALQFLQKQLGQTEIVKKLRDKHLKSLPQWVLQNNALMQKGLIKVIKSFVQMDKKIKQYYAQRKPASDAQDQQQAEQQKKQKRNSKKIRKTSVASQVEQNQKGKSKSKLKSVQPQTKKHHQNTSLWVKNKFQAPQNLEQIGKQDKTNQTKNIKKPSMTPKEASSEQSQDRPLHSDHSQSQQVPKPIKKKNKQEKKIQQKKMKSVKKKKSQSQEQSSSQSQKQEPQTKKSKRAAKIQKKDQKQAQKKSAKVSQKVQEKLHKMHTRSQDQRHEVNNNTDMVDQKDQYNNNGYKRSGHASTFSRIKIDQVGPIPKNLQDNSFEAKFKYGKGGDQWGRYGHQKLKDTRGDSFKKTKDKLKNKAFQGTNIDFNVINSIPLD